MKTIIAGSREIKNFEIISKAIEESGFEITEVVSGTARGVDTQGEAWASYHGVPIRRFRPEWDKYGQRAGFVRNEEMAKYADALVAVWDTKSRGTLHMINTAIKHGLKVFIYEHRI
jgi:hypothetical protein